LSFLFYYIAGFFKNNTQKKRNNSQKKHARFIYLRFHGPAGDYRGSYDTDFLRDQYERIMDWQANGKDVYAYFNNTIGSAFENAMSLQAIARSMEPRLVTVSGA
ncbi:MAG: DUF72 domain-containing protein, partial [Ferruginibacter sp.]